MVGQYEYCEMTASAKLTAKLLRPSVLAKGECLNYERTSSWEVQENCKLSEIFASDVSTNIFFVRHHHFPVSKLRVSGKP
jgi:hypothetical protein